jgi:hypothetical protein
MLEHILLNTCVNREIDSNVDSDYFKSAACSASK